MIASAQDALASKWNSRNSATPMARSLANEKVAGMWLNTEGLKVRAQIIQS